MKKQIINVYLKKTWELSSQRVDRTNEWMSALLVNVLEPC